MEKCECERVYCWACYPHHEDHEDETSYKMARLKAQQECADDVMSHRAEFAKLATKASGLVDALKFIDREMEAYEDGRCDACLYNLQNIRPLAQTTLNLYHLGPFQDVIEQDGKSPAKCVTTKEVK